jgi:uncharacterized membrane protein
MIIDYHKHKEQALARMTGNWMGGVYIWLFVAVMLGIYYLTDYIKSPLLSVILSVLYGMFCLLPLNAGLASVFLKLMRRNKPLSVFDVMDGFDIWWKAIETQISMLLSVSTIHYGSLVNTSQALFIILENPEISPAEALVRSKEMMKGNTDDYLAMQFSFLPMYGIGLLTCGIGFLWYGSYIYAAQASFYMEVSKNYKPEAEDPVFAILRGAK